MTARVAVLGQLQVSDGEGALATPRGLAARVLVTLVATRPGRLTDDALLDRCWAGDPVPTARYSLRNTVMRIRKQLGSSVIRREGDAYGLGAEVRTDLDELDEHLASASAARLRGDAASERREIERALQLVRGRPFEAVADELWAMPMVRSWEAVIAELEDRWMQLAAHARDATALPRVHQLAAARPEREARWVELARLEHALGLRAEAIRTVRRALRAVAEIGLEPSRPLVQLEREVLEPIPRGSPSSEPASVASAPLFGRGDELQRLRDLLARHSFVTLVGLGGCGKSRLALEVAMATASACDVDVVLVDLTRGNRGGHLLVAVADALDLRVDPAADDAALLVAIRELLRHAPCVIVLDGADVDREATHRLVDGLPDRIGAARVIATARLPLGVRHEVIFRTAPLAVPACDATVADIESSPAVQLLRHHLGTMHGPRAAPDGAESFALAAMVRSVGGNPLAIRLCAHLARTMPVSDLASGLDDHRLLNVADRSMDGIALRSIFDRVIECLSEDELAVFRRCAAAPAAFTAPAARAMLDLGDLRTPVTVCLARLVDASLLQMHHVEGVTRFDMDALQRAIGAELLELAGERRAVEERFVTHVCERARTLSPGLRDGRQRDALRALLAERDAHRWVLAQVDVPVDRRLDLTNALGEMWFLNGDWLAGVERFDVVLAETRTVPSAARAVALIQRVRTAGVLSAAVSALPDLEESIATAEQLGLAPVAAEARAFLGLALISGGDLDAGRVMLQAATRAAPHAPWAAAQARMFLGMVRAIGGGLERGADEVCAAANAFSRLGDEFSAANALKNIGIVLQRYGETDRAERELRTALQLAGGHLPALAAQARLALAEIDVGRGRVDREELAWLRVALRRIGDLTSLSAVHRILARDLCAGGDTDGARSVLVDSIVHLATHDGPELGLVLADLAEMVDAGGGSGREAAELAAAALHLSRRVAYGWNAADRRRIEALAARLGVVDACGAHSDGLVERGLRIALGMAPATAPDAR